MLDAKLVDLRGMCGWVERDARAEDEVTCKAGRRGRGKGART